MAQVSERPQNNDDDEHEAQASRWIVAPAA